MSDSSFKELQGPLSSVGFWRCKLVWQLYSWKLSKFLFPLWSTKSEKNKHSSSARGIFYRLLHFKVIVIALRSSKYIILNVWKESPEVLRRKINVFPQSHAVNQRESDSNNKKKKKQNHKGKSPPSDCSVYNRKIKFQKKKKRLFILQKCCSFFIFFLKKK